jgi:hypothetical protein
MNKKKIKYVCQYYQTWKVCLCVLMLDLHHLCEDFLFLVCALWIIFMLGSLFYYSLNGEYILANEQEDSQVYVYRHCEAWKVCFDVGITLLVWRFFVSCMCPMNHIYVRISLLLLGEWGINTYQWTRDSQVYVHRHYEAWKVCLCALMLDLHHLC